MSTAGIIQFEMIDPNGRHFIQLGHHAFRTTKAAILAWQQIPTRESGTGEMFACLLDAEGKIKESRPVTDFLVEQFLSRPLSGLVSDALRRNAMLESEWSGYALCQ